MLPSRRRFLASLAPMAAVPLRLSARPPHVLFPDEAKARIAVASYPFRKLLDPNTGTVKLVDFPALVVAQFGVRGIEPLGRHFPSTHPVYLAMLRRAIEQAKTHVVDIPVGVHASFYDPDAKKRRTAIHNARHWVDVARKLGSPSIRVSIQGVAGVTPDVARTAASLAEVAAYGAKHNVVINLENDNPRSEDAFFVTSVIERAATPWLRALPDFCNSMIEKSGDTDFNYRAVTAMFQHAYNISHVKDSEVDGGKVYSIDLAKTFAIAKAAGYRGYFSMEWEGAGEPVAGTKFLIEETLRNLAK